MKKILCLIVTSALLFALAGCSTNNVNNSEIQPLNNRSEKNEIAKLHFENAFSGEEEVFLHDGASSPLALCRTYDGYVYNWAKKMAYIDFDKDGVDEVLIDAMGYYILNYDFEEEKIYATFFTPRGGCVFFENGEYWHNDTDLKRYRIESFSKGKIEAVTVEYTNTKPITNRPEWTEVEIKIGLPNKFEYKIIVDNNKKRLNIYDNGTFIQAIEYDNAENITEKDFYFEDVDFDGAEDLIIPAASPAYGIWFYSYKWNNEENRFVKFSSIDEIANPVIDYENKQILHHLSGNQTTSYIKSEYNENGFLVPIASLIWQPAYLKLGTTLETETRIYIREEINGVVNEFFVPSNPDYQLEPDKSCDEFKKYTEAGSYWDIESSKWEDYFFNRYSSEEFTSLGVESKLISKESFTNDITVEFDGKSITVKAPRFTGIPSNAIDGSKNNYWCQDGYYIFAVSTANGIRNYKIDNNGKILDKDLSEIREFPRERNLIKSKTSEYTYSGETIAGGYTLCGLKDKDGKALTPAEYTRFSILGEYAIGHTPHGSSDIYGLNGELQGKMPVASELCGDGLIKSDGRLFNIKGEAISEKFDRIGFFADGLALVEKDNKIGLISSTGKTILEPTIVYDQIVYPPTLIELSPTYIEEDSFYLSIGGELAIINIDR